MLALAFLLGGLESLAGASVGLGLVVLFLLSGRLPFLVDAQLAPGVAYLVLGINYLFRVVLLLVALVALKDQSWLDARALGLVVIGGALVWNAIALRKHLDGLGKVNSSETETGSNESIPSGTQAGGSSR
ncbi:hypothetical protein [Cryptosporangium phraense]|uniref:ATP synthase subunit I n=1 Tax=Cryptosporangium phraense TaxID=2593070 RepID=A0A545AS93_9ACTN|nr:hypothetical protein [Cryptosporangium phraense]TQS44143.1 hypothetical protein FL583_14385 [Cryptosporangium phraense]